MYVYTCINDSIIVNHYYNYDYYHYLSYNNRREARGGAGRGRCLLRSVFIISTRKASNMIDSNVTYTY